jgi:hypothetical protein
MRRAQAVMTAACVIGLHVFAKPGKNSLNRFSGWFDSCSPRLCIAQHDKFKAESRKYIQQRSRSFAQERRSGWQVQGERS